MKDDPIYGLMAEFDSATDIVAAARRTHEAGYKKIDAYSPFPIEELAEAIGFHHNNVALVVLIGGLCGCAHGISVAVLGFGGGLSDQRWRQAFSFLAVIHHCDL